MTDRRLVQRTLLAWAIFELAAAAQIRGPDHVTVLTRWIRLTVEPVASMVVGTTLWVEQQVSGLANAHRLAAENRHLHLDVERLTTANALLQNDLDTVLQGASSLALLPRTEVTPARCIARNLGRGSLRLVISSGAKGPIAVDTPVFAAGGIVGRVFRSEGSTCWVETIVHAAAAIAVTSDDGSVQALAQGSGDGTLSIQFVPHRAPLTVGDRLYSSGGDGVYPPGLPVADVLSVRETNSSFLDIRARPVANIQSVTMVWLIHISTNDNTNEALVP